MQFHQLTVGRNVGATVDAIDVDNAIAYVAKSLRDLSCYSFSVFQGKGYWNDVPENIIRFEIFGITDSEAKNLARSLAEKFSQEAVMLLSINSRPKFIARSM